MGMLGSMMICERIRKERSPRVSFWISLLGLKLEKRWMSFFYICFHVSVSISI